MPIIKAHAGSAPTSSDQVIRRVAFNFDDMAQQAKQYLDQVRKQASAILKEARVEAQEIAKQAEQQGRKAGMLAVDQMMTEKLSKQLETLTPAINQAVLEIQNSRQQWLNHWQQSAVKLACAIAARVIRRELSQTPEITLDLVAEALQMATGSAELRIHMHPDDASALGDQVHKLTDSVRDIASATVVPDPAITRGGCRVETRFGSIDQQIESQLERIEQELI